MRCIETPNVCAQLDFKFFETHVGVLKHISINIQMWDIKNLTHVFNPILRFFKHSLLF